MTDKAKHIVAVGRTLNIRRLTSALHGLLCLLLLMTAAAAQKPAKSEGDSRFTTLDKTRIHYVSYGKGREALVLVHGWSCNAEYWHDQIGDFAKRNRVIAVDLPGHGQS